MVVLVHQLHLVVEELGIDGSWNDEAVVDVVDGTTLDSGLGVSPLPMFFLVEHGHHSSLLEESDGEANLGGHQVQVLESHLGVVRGDDSGKEFLELEIQKMSKTLDDFTQGHLLTLGMFDLVVHLEVDGSREQKLDDDEGDGFQVFDQLWSSVGLILILRKHVRNIGFEPSSDISHSLPMGKVDIQAVSC
jgi:hypothetical protein